MEDEFIYDLHIKLNDITNSYFALGENMLEEKLVRNILKYFPQKFDMKVTAIEEVQNLRNFKVDELIGFLRRFEVSINEKSKKKNKGVAFVSNIQEKVDRGDKDTEDRFY